MTLNDAIKITQLLQAQLKDCKKLSTDGLAFSQQDYERALVVVLEATKAYLNDERGH